MYYHMMMKNKALDKKEESFGGGRVEMWRRRSTDLGEV